MPAHYLKPVYTPCSWSVDPAVMEADLTPKMRRQMKRLGDKIAAAMHAQTEANFTASLPVKRNRVAEEMGAEYVEGLDFTKIAFELAMLRQL